MIPKLSDQVIQKIKDLRATGRFYRQIAEQLNISHSAAWWYGHRVHVSVKQKVVKELNTIPEWEIKKIRFLWENDVNVKDIIRQTGRSEGTVRKYIKEKL